MGSRPTPVDGDWENVTSGGEWETVTPQQPMVGKIPKATLDNLRTQSQQPTQFEIDRSQLHPPSLGDVTNAVGNFASDLYQSGKGAVQALASPTIPGKAGAFIPPPVSMAANAAKGYYQAVQDRIQAAKQAGEQRDTSGVMFNSAAAGIPLVGPLIGGIYEQAKSGDTSGAIGKGASRVAQILSMAPESSALPNPARGTVNAAVKGYKAFARDTSPQANLASLATTGGQPGKGVAVTDIASPELTERFRQNYAKSPAAQSGVQDLSPDTFRETARNTVADINTEMQRYMAPVRGRSLGGLQTQIASELRQMADSTNIESRANSLRAWAARIEQAKTGGDLLKIKSDAFQDASKASFGEVTADAGADAGHDVGSAIIRNYYPEISKVVGRDLGPLGKLEQQAVQLQSQAEKAYPKLQASDVANRTMPIGQKVSPLDLLRPKSAALSAAQTTLTPKQMALFRANFKAVVNGATPGNPPVQGPLQIVPGKYGGPTEGPNPGQGPMTPAGSTGPQPNTGTPYQSPFGTPKMADMVKGEGGGHAGNVAASLEELNRPGQNVSFSASGQPTFHGKSFDPGSVPPKGAHITVFPDNTYRVNAGVMTPALENAIKLFLKNYRK